MKSIYVGSLAAALTVAVPALAATSDPFAHWSPIGNAVGRAL